ncbi:hypothetical protein CDL15_Pgr005872 [Punica granatum]|uniref:Uncharacterized protein n=1 Tax=Punica granatum TaxID=22663 RepID=A0A218WFR2_PUNGR|nr:hypothetical protein CDL15_Pgr005872 [Punica granatum]PKI59666.1 hypothetical protein CRG98_019928 [Punica granatum]
MKWHGQQDRYAFVLPSAIKDERLVKVLTFIDQCTWEAGRWRAVRSGRATAGEVEVGGEEPKLEQPSRAGGGRRRKVNRLRKEEKNGEERG